MTKFAAALAVSVLILAGIAWALPGEMSLERVQRIAWRHAGLPPVPARVQRDLRIEAADGAALATDVYRPLMARGGLPTVLMRLPYGKRDYNEVYHFLTLFLRHGYAVVVQDMRGRFASEGEFLPYEHDADDGVATLDWIVAQPWSNGRVGTIGCSALGESQILLAARRHPAHRAMIPIGAGGAIGSLGDSHGYFAFFEGGILNLSSAFGWFARWGGKSGSYMGAPPIDYARAVEGLPVISLVARYRADPTDYEGLILNFANDAVMRGWGYVSQEDRFSVPSLMLDTWYDTGIDSSFRLSAHMQAGAPDQHLIVAPGTHCYYEATWGAVGEMPVSVAAMRDYDALFVAFFDQWLRDGSGPGLARYSYYMLGADAWLEADQWPPGTTRLSTFALSAAAQSDGSGALLAPTEVPEAGVVGYVADPQDPVPAIGGATCCTNDPDLIEGPAFQNAIETRPDVVTFTSAPLERPLRLAGPVAAVLHVSADVPDADIVARLSVVDESGRSLMIQEGALRLRYRDGFDEPVLLPAGQVVEARIPMRHIAYEFAPGTRLRLTIASSNFPRLERNLQTGGRNYDETEGQRGEIRIHTGSGTFSRLELNLLTDE